MTGWVYDSERYAIVAFPRYDAMELIDKLTSRSAFLVGATARGLHHSIIQIPEDERTTEAVDELLDDFSQDRVLPMAVH
jgi:hypothetical protein